MSMKEKDNTGTVMDEELVISSGGDYDPEEEKEAISEDNVPLDQENSI